MTSQEQPDYQNLVLKNRFLQSENVVKRMDFSVVDLSSGSGSTVSAGPRVHRLPGLSGAQKWRRRQEIVSRPSAVRRRAGPAGAAPPLVVVNAHTLTHTSTHTQQP